MPVTFPTIPVSQQSTRTTVPDVLKASLGNGAEQRMANGINYLRDMWVVTWESLSSTDRDTILAFLVNISAGDYTTWTTPLDGAAKKFTLEGSWTLSTKGGNNFDITASLRQVFDA